MEEEFKDKPIIRKLRKSMLYSRIRQHFPQGELFYLDDKDFMREENAQIVQIEWPENVRKPHVGVVQDYWIHPKWTKYLRFLQNNEFPYSLYNIHASDWIEKVQSLDVIIGVPSSIPFLLEEIQRKYYFLERYMGKICYPSTEHAFLYENKQLEAYLSELHGFPFVKTYISHDKNEALELIKKLQYPVVSKIDPSSGSIGVELIPDLKRCRKLVERAFSNNGRKTYLNYFRQKNYIYLQDFVPNDGNDIRVILVGNMAFGYYRKAPQGEFRASGMNLYEMGGLPEESIRIAYQLNREIKSPMIVVDMLRDLNGKYTIIEYSPFCQIHEASQLEVDGEAGVYIIDEEGGIHFEKGRFFVPELALREFFLQDYLPRFGSAV